MWLFSLGLNSWGARQDRNPNKQTSCYTPPNPKLERWQEEKRPAKSGQHGKSRVFSVKESPGERKTRNKGSFTGTRSTEQSSKVLWKSFDMSRDITQISVENGVWWMRTMYELPTQIRIKSNAQDNTTMVNYKGCQVWAGRGHRRPFLLTHPLSMSLPLGLKG